MASINCLFSSLKKLGKSRTLPLCHACFLTLDPVLFFVLTFLEAHHDVADVGGAGGVDGRRRVVLEALADGVTLLRDTASEKNGFT